MIVQPRNSHSAALEILQLLLKPTFRYPVYKKQQMTEPKPDETLIPPSIMFGLNYYYYYYYYHHHHHLRYAGCLYLYS
jgi:hypothetical protein